MKLQEYACCCLYTAVKKQPRDKAIMVHFLPTENIYLLKNSLQYLWDTRVGISNGFMKVSWFRSCHRKFTLITSGCDTSSMPAALEVHQRAKATRDDLIRALLSVPKVGGLNKRSEVKPNCLPVRKMWIWNTKSLRYLCLPGPTEISQRIAGVCMTSAKKAYCSQKLDWKKYFCTGRGF